MLAIQASYHDGHIEIPTTGLPRDAKVVVVFLTPDASDAQDSIGNLNEEQLAALKLQSHNSFSTNVLLNPAEDCWNDA